MELVQHLTHCFYYSHSFLCLFLMVYQFAGGTKFSTRSHLVWKLNSVESGWSKGSVTICIPYPWGNFSAYAGGQLTSYNQHHIFQTAQPWTGQLSTNDHGPISTVENLGPWMEIWQLSWINVSNKKFGLRRESWIHRNAISTIGIITIQIGISMNWRGEIIFDEG